MKNFIFSLVFFFILGNISLAQEFSLPEPGLTPESPVYFLDLLDERLRLFITTNPDKRVRRHIVYAEERLAEAHELAGRGVAGSRRALELYTKQISDLYTAVDFSKNLEQIREALSLVKDHLSVLDNISERTPFTEKKFVLDAKYNLIDEQKLSLEHFFKDDPEVAAEILLTSLGGRLERIRQVARDNENIEEAFEEYVFYMLFLIRLSEKEISIHNTNAQVYFIQATSGQEEVLRGYVRERVGISFQRSLEEAINVLRKLHALVPISLNENTLPEDAHNIPKDASTSPIDSSPTQVSNPGSSGTSKAPQDIEDTDSPPGQPGSGRESEGESGGDLTVPPPPPPPGI